MRFKTLILYFHTVRHLKFIQIRYQLVLRIKRYVRVGSFHSYNGRTVQLELINWIDKQTTFSGNAFCFLNQKMDIPDQEINWDFMGYGKLWIYNLHYMDYLLQPNMTSEIGQLLIDKYIKALTKDSPGLDPYPISLRGINWIKFFTRHHIRNANYDRVLFNHYIKLYHNPEFHLLANHLIENAFSLLYGSFYFGSPEFFKKAKAILEKEIKIQVLSDGGHFERSPMYHQILLDRILDCINLLENNNVFNGEQNSLLKLLQEKARLMLGWLNAMTFANGEIPMFNDSAPAISPVTAELNQYALRLKIIQDQSFSLIKPGESGYRKYKGSNYECFVDIGEISPDYQPGHSHAGTFSFVLQYHNKPFIVDTGVSTYEKNSRRSAERGTSAHNTVQVREKDSSEVWGGFRVGRRARIKLIQDNESEIIASHNGYESDGIIHERSFKFQPNEIFITDRIVSDNKMVLKARLHFHPDVSLSIKGNTAFCNNIKIEFSGHSSLEISEYLFAMQFNMLRNSRMIEIDFNRKLITKISI